tara:strand:- start:381 stop:902 length:522 start_codon:yes stop_codon:yes gene_type:complete
MGQLIDEAVKTFFANYKNFSQLKEIQHNKFVQPRLIDFYVTQYAKNNPVFFVLSIDGKTYGLLDVYSSYKLQLKGYHKKMFNLFDKRREIIVESNGECVELPVARLNVYKWLIENSIIDLLYTNQYIIQASYYEFRKSSVRHDREQRKRGKMNTFLKHPLILSDLNAIKKWKK